MPPQGHSWQQNINPHPPWQLRAGVKDEFGIVAADLTYHIEKGGTYLKEEASLTDLGMIGLIKLFLDPDHGPRIRLKAMSFESEFQRNGQIDFDPCVSCHRPCIIACPQKVFYSGAYDKEACSIQMNFDVEKQATNTSVEDGSTINVGKFCLVCELSCPVGK